MFLETVSSLAGVGALLSLTAWLVGKRASMGVLASAWIAYGGVQLITSTFLLWRLEPSETRWATSSWRQLIKVAKGGIAFGVCTAFTLVCFYASTLMVSKFVSVEAVGQLTMAYNLVFAVFMIPQVFVDSAFPMLSRRFALNDEPLAALAKIGSLFLLLAVPLGILGCILAEPILHTVYGARAMTAVGSANAADVFSVLIFYGVLLFFTYLFGAALGAANRQGEVTRIAAGGMVINLVLNLILIPRLGIIGAAFSNVVAETCVLFALSWRLLPLRVLREFWRPALEAAAGSLLIAAILQLQSAHYVPPLALGLMAASAYLGALFFTGSLRESVVLLRRRLG